MNFEEKLKERKDWELWKEYCGFLDLTIDEFMAIQNRLMLEQIRMWKKSGIGRTLLKGKEPETIEEFRKMVPLTSYEDYADILSLKDKSMLPDDPVVWIQTTWEGGQAHHQAGSIYQEHAGNVPEQHAGLPHAVHQQRPGKL